jgi:F-type H+-transporting ATPase subunit delta
MSVTAVANRYAKSLLDLSIEQNEVDTTLADMKSFASSFESKDMMYLLKSPIISAKAKHKIFQEAFGSNFSKLSNNFLSLVINKGREEYLPEIVGAFMEQYNAYKGVTSVTLTSATPIAEEVVATIRQRLAESKDTKNHIEVITKVNPDLIGGFTLNIADKLYNASVAHQLEELKKEFAK